MQVAVVATHAQSQSTAATRLHSFPPTRARIAPGAVVAGFQYRSTYVPQHAHVRTLLTAPRLDSLMRCSWLESTNSSGVRNRFVERSHVRASKRSAKHMHALAAMEAFPHRGFFAVGQAGPATVPRAMALCGGAVRLGLRGSGCACAQPQQRARTLAAGGWSAAVCARTAVRGREGGEPCRRAAVEASQQGPRCTRRAWVTPQELWGTAMAHGTTGRLARGARACRQEICACPVRGAWSNPPAAAHAAPLA